MVAVVALVDGEFGRIVVVLGNSGGEFGFFFGVVADFMSITNPTTLGLVA